MTTPSQSRPRRSWLGTAVLWMRRQRPNWLQISLALGIVISLIALAVPARALQVRLSPTNPQLGDTLSLVVQQNPTLSSTPTVKMGQKTYPTFVTNSGNFRALVPTTPLDKPGTLQIQVAGEGEVKNLAVPLRNRSFPTQRIRLSGAAGAEATQQELGSRSGFQKVGDTRKILEGIVLEAQ
jgi:hypothetical protein